MSSDTALWFGRIPDRWSWGPLGRYFTERRETVSDQLFTPLSVTKDGIVPQLDTAAKTNDGDNRKRVAKGDFVINSRSDRKGSSGLSMLDGSVSVISTVITPRASLRPEFVHHLLRSAQFQEEYYRYGTGIVADLWSTRYSQMKKIPIPVPPVEEQRRIAEFLDRETAQIDELIAKQEQLISTLAERRISLVREAVRRGRDSTATFMDSGVRWIGKMPANWTTPRLGHLLQVRNGSDYKDVQEDDGQYPVYGSGGEFARANSYLHDGNALMLGRKGTIDRPLLVSGRFWTVDTMFYATPSTAIDLRYYFYAALCFPYAELSTATALPSMTASALKAIRVPRPPLDEQRSIADFLAAATDEIDALRAKAVQVIALLGERRQALISAAVTGNIDVGGAS